MVRRSPDGTLHCGLRDAVCGMFSTRSQSLEKLPAPLPPGTRVTGSIQGGALERVELGWRPLRDYPLLRDHATYPLPGGIRSVPSAGYPLTLADQPGSWFSSPEARRRGAGKQQPNRQDPPFGELVEAAAVTGAARVVAAQEDPRLARGRHRPAPGPRRSVHRTL
jgi:hypothetical protein